MRLHVGRGCEHRGVGRVRLGRGREIRDRLRQRNAALRQSDEVHGVLRGDGDDERLRIGVADVLGGEDHHAPRDEERILAGLEHAHEPVDRRVGIAVAQALDERGDDVVVLLAGLVVEERLLLRGLLGEPRGRSSSAPLRADDPGGDLERAERTRASPCACRDQKSRASGASCESRRAEAALADRRARARGSARISSVAERLEHDARASATAAARSPRRTGSRSSRRSARRCRASTCGRKRILLRFVEAMDLVDEKHRLAAVQREA